MTDIQKTCETKCDSANESVFGKCVTDCVKQETCKKCVKDAEELFPKQPEERDFWIESCKKKNNCELKVK